MADVAYDTARALLTRADALAADPSPLTSTAEDATEDVRTVLSDHGQPTLEFELDLRYEGQSYELSVPLAAPITGAGVRETVDTFHTRHRERYGHAAPHEPVEVVALRVRGRVEVEPPRLPVEPETDTPIEEAVLGTRPVWFDADGPTKTTAYARSRLHHGHALEGPAILHQYDTTIVLPPGWHARIDARQNVRIER
jgi:N-methylhydantoinase A